MKNQFIYIIFLFLFSCASSNRRQLTTNEIKKHKLSKDSIQRINTECISNLDRTKKECFKFECQESEKNELECFEKKIDASEVKQIGFFDLDNLPEVKGGGCRYEKSYSQPRSCAVNFQTQEKSVNTVCVGKEVKDQPDDIKGTCAEKVCLLRKNPKFCSIKGNSRLFSLKI